MLFVMKVLFLCFHWWMTLNNVVCWIRLLLPWIGNNCSDLLPVQIFICKFLLNKTNANKTFFTVCQKEDWRIFFVIYCMNIYVCGYSPLALYKVSQYAHSFQKPTVWRIRLMFVLLSGKQQPRFLFLDIQLYLLRALS